MIEEFNLSEKIKELFEVEYLDSMADVQGDVSKILKEFLKRLKDEYMKYRDSFKTLEDYYRIFNDIDKLAGDKLI